MCRKNNKKKEWEKESFYSPINNWINKQDEHKSTHFIIWSGISVRKSPCVLRGFAASLLSAPRSLAGRTAGGFDRQFMPVNLSHRIPPLGFYRRNHRRMCEAALSCYDTISGTGGRWSMTGLTARRKKKKKKKLQAGCRRAATPYEHNQ